MPRRSGLIIACAALVAAGCRFSAPAARDLRRNGSPAVVSVSTKSAPAATRLETVLVGEAPGARGDSDPRTTAAHRRLPREDRALAQHKGIASGVGRLIRQAQHEDSAATGEPEHLPVPHTVSSIQAESETGDVARFAEAAGNDQAGDVTSPVFTASSEQAAPAPVPAIEQPQDRYPITLATALQLAGSSNLQVALAQERVREAYAVLDRAQVLWVPNLNGGVAFNDHAGQLQAIDGQIFEVNRQSLFAGGGAGLGRSALAGGGNPPARLGVDLSPVDIIFEPLAARQTVHRTSADASAVFNDTMFRVSLAYLDLVRAQAQVAIARETIANARELVQLTSEFARTGAGLEADAQRARADLADRERELLAAEEFVRVVSAELARLLRLDQSIVLFALETQPLPIELIPGDVPLEALIAQGVQMRPEISREAAQVGATEDRLSQEQWRPWVPTLHVGVGGGTFGGGRNSNFGDFSGRYDLDALAVWELRNFGFGNHALVRERSSQRQQAYLAYEAARDQVATDVAQAWHRAQLRRGQIPLARQQIAAAADALPLNFNGIRGRELRPIEAQQAIAALALARNRYVNAVIEHNQAQLALWRAVGQPPDASASMPAAGDVVPPAPAAGAR